MVVFQRREPTGQSEQQLHLRKAPSKYRRSYLPTINAPAHERDTFCTVLLRCIQISHDLNHGQSTIVTLDEQLYSKAKELQWENPEVCSNIFLRLWSFHITKNFMKATWRHYTDSGGRRKPSEVMQQLEDAAQVAHLLQLLEQYDETLPPTGA